MKNSILAPLVNLKMGPPVNSIPLGVQGRPQAGPE